MKIILLSDGIPPELSGGAERVAWLSALDLTRAGHEVHLITSTAGAAFSERRQGVMTYHLHAAYPIRWQAWLSLYNPQTVGPLRHLLKQIRPDVLHAHNIHRNLSYASLAIAAQLEIPVVLTAHDLMPVAYTKLTHWIDPQWRGPDYSVFLPARYRLPRFYNMRQMRLRYNPFRNPIIRRVISHAVRTRLCVSNAQRQALEINGLAPFEVVYNGIDSSQYDGPEIAVLAQTLRERWQLVGKKVVLFAGRLTAEKGSTRLFAAMQQVVAQLPDAQLLILTNHVEAWEKSPYREVLADYVTIGGWLQGTELLAVMKAADVVCTPSISMDPAPMVVLETMAAQKPIVATCFGGSSELVVDGETGFIVNPYDTSQMADRLLRVLNNPETSASMGIAGRQRVDARFSLVRQTEAFTAVYRQLINLNRHTL